MKKLSILIKFISLFLLFVVLTNSVGHAMTPTIPNAQTLCGEWKVESVNSAKDQRIGIILRQQATGSDCGGVFTLSNQTGTLVGGGYTLELVTGQINANIKFLPYDDPVLIPGLNMEIKATPIDINKQANILIKGEATPGSILAVDLPFFALRTALELIPLPTGCVVSYDQLVLISLRTAPILENAAKLALEGNFIGSQEEFSRVINVFYEKAGDVARDIGIGCFADYLKSIIGKPVVIAKIGLAYLTWIGTIFVDYLWKYQGAPVSISLSYTPSVPTSTSRIDQQLVVNANIEWINTGITINQGETVDIKYVSGRWRGFPGNEWGDGTDCNAAFPRAILPTASGTALIARVGTGTPRCVGNTPFVSSNTGVLYLTYNDCPGGCFSDNEGSITVRVKVYK